MTIFLDKDGKEITAKEFCRGRKDVPHRWQKQAKAEKPAKKKEVKE